MQKFQGPTLEFLPWWDAFTPGRTLLEDLETIKGRADAALLVVSPESETVVSDLHQPGGDRYYTDAGGTRANVVVVTCPSCTFNDYLRTDPDRTTSNNLLSLPRV
ncbi:MAG: DUF3892 domain-containing protein [Chloroflexi bacterium]|nr:DUF3892 domain-containing protein [Chloroflexota bacterium]